MNRLRLTGGLVALSALAVMGCRNHMPHGLTWPAGGDIEQTHAKPPEGGYYTNWDPYAVSVEVTPVEAVNPVQTQHVLVATVRDKDGKPLPNRRVEWTIEGVGNIVEVDESGWRASRGYKVDNDYAVSHTNNFDHVLTRGNEDPSDDVTLVTGQTWCVITSPVEGDTHVTVYAPGIYDWDKHKVFAVKHWYDVAWEFPPDATNCVGGSHEFVTSVSKYSDGSALEGYVVTYTLEDGPSGTFDSGSTTATVRTDGSGMARATLRQSSASEGTNTVRIDIMRQANEACCEPPVHIATGYVSKTWVGGSIAISKSAPSIVDCAAPATQFSYDIRVSNPSSCAISNVMVSDPLPSGVSFVSSNPSTSGGSNLSWNVGTIEAGGERMISVTVSAPEGVYENCATVTAGDLTDRACATTEVPGCAQIVLEKTCTPEVTVCEMIEHRLVVRNVGQSPATNVTVTDDLPDGLVAENGSRSLRFSAGTLAPGEAKQASFRVKAERTGRYTNRATASGDGGLSASAECSTVVTQPVLAVTKTGSDIRYIGRDAEYTITVRNAGDAPARDTVLTDTIPAETQFRSASDNGSFSNGLVTWSLGTLEPGASRTVTVMVNARSAGTARNTAKARAVCADAEASYAMEIKGIPAILLEVIDIEDPIEAGSDTTYVITVTNQGSAVGTNIRIVATVQAEATYKDAAGPVAASVSGRTVTFAPLPSLAPGAKATYRITITGNSEGDTRFGVSMTSDQTDSSVDETESTRIY